MGFLYHLRLLTVLSFLLFLQVELNLVFSKYESLIFRFNVFVLSLNHTENITYVRLIGPEESLIEGESSANFSSEGTGNISSVQWMKDNSPLSPSNSIIFSSDNRSVSISPVQRSDSGEYQCTYRNPVSSGTEKLSLIINCES